jgi:two-component system response regulator YesN
MRAVLIVDDEPLVRVTLRSTVDWRRWGFDRPAEASNGEEALAFLTEHPGTALVMLDLVMPGMDGLELLRRLRDRGPAPHVIVLTGHDEFSMVREAFKLGASDYLLKSELDQETLAPLLETAARRLERFGGPAGAAGHAAALKQETLHRLLESDRPELLRADLKACGVELGVMLRIGLLAIQDFEVVAARYDAVTRPSFSVTVMAVVEQILERHGNAEILRVSDEEYVIFQFFRERRPAARTEEAGARLAKEAAAALHDYLNVAAAVSWTEAAEYGRGCGPACLYRALAAGRRRPSRLIERAQEHVRENLAEPGLHLQGLAAELGVTPNHLSAQFTKETGRSFRGYLSYVRMEAAKRLLAGSGLKVWEVAERVGYLNVEHFSRVFKKLTGVPPHLFTREPRSP